MLRIASPAFAGLILLCSASHAYASGSVGIYGMIEKIVFEPNEQAPERVQVWGAFAFLENQSSTISEVRKGYLYFRLPTGSSQDAANARTEWKDLKAVAGTGQAVAFGRWGYIGAFEGLQSETRTAKTYGPPYTLAREPGNPQTDVRVRPASEAPAGPASYSTNVGIVKLSADGNQAEIVKKLKDALKP